MVGTVAAFESEAVQHGLTLVVAGVEPSPVVLGEARHLRRVVANLVSNALAHTPEGGRITVQLAASEGIARLTVEDTGSGIPAEALPHVFDRFYQVETSPTSGRAGTGIGLALAKELVEAHGGTVSVTSEVGVGSTFVATLPTTDAAPVALAPSSSQAVTVPRLPRSMAEASDDSLALGERPTLLLVEDHAALRDFLARALAEGYEVHPAADGAEALVLAKSLRPDLIVSDVMIPNMDGLALTAALRTDEALRATPIVLLTARADDADRVAGLDTGADVYLAKPFSLPVLRAHLDALVARHQTLRDRFRREVVVQPSEIVVTSDDAAFVERVRAVVEDALADPHLTVEVLADRLAVSPRQLHRRMRALTGLTPAAFVRAMRLQRAATLLAGRSGTVAEVAYAVGFRSESHFTKRFKTEFGVLPSVYGEG
ncbi:MAG: ATP-binding protein [Bacteroidota bacterium]